MSEVYHQPTMEFTIKVNKKVPSTEEEKKISFNKNYNQILINHKCTNQSINNYQIWVTYYRYEAESLAKFPATGVAGNYYYAKDTEKYYKYVDGSYVETTWEEPESGLNVGIRAFEDVGALAQNTARDANIYANNTVFTRGDGVYKLCLCARGDLDMTWDVTEVLLVISGLIFQPTDNDAVEMVVNGAPTARIPAQYQEVAWIKSASDGSAYIPISYSTSEIDRVEFRANCATEFAIIGNGGDTDYTGIRLFGNASATYCGINTDRTQLALEAIPRGTFVDGYMDQATLYNGSTSYTLTYTGTATSTGIRVLGDKNFDDKGSTLYNGLRLYGTSIVLNLVTCYRKLDNKIGLFDVINQVFYPGTGEFTKGPDLPVNYTVNITGVNCQVNYTSAWNTCMSNDNKLTVNITTDGVSYQVPEEKPTIPNCTSTYRRLSDTHAIIVLSEPVDNISFTVEGSGATVSYITTASGEILQDVQDRNIEFTS